MSKDLNSQIPWFATSNGVIDLQTSADHRDHRYTNNKIDDQTLPNSTDKPLNTNHNTNNNTNNNTTNNNNNTNSATSKGSLKLSSTNLSSKVGEGGLPLPPLTDKIGRPFSTKSSPKEEPVKVPPAPKDNELYGDILVIPPIRQKQQVKNEDFSIPTLEVFTEITCMTQKTFNIDDL